MNFEIFWSVLSGTLFAAFIVAVILRPRLDRLLRITLADYEDFLRGERYVQECKDEEAKKYDDRSPDEYFDAQSVIRGVHFENRQTFTGEDFSEQIAEGKWLQEKFMEGDE